MSDFSFVRDNISNYYVAGICEGNAEQALMEILLDNDLLIFNRDNLVDEQFNKYRSNDSIIQNYLQVEYDKELVIFKIQDSPKEKNKLKKPYDKYKIYYFTTRYEIELIFIHYDGLYDEFQKVSSKEKASSFYKRKNKKYKKDSEYVKEHFKDLDKLVEAIRKSRPKRGLCIYDLLKD